MGGSTSVSAALRRALESDAGRYRWVAATSGSQSAAADELATGGDPVMAIGGFSGEGGHISLSRFEQDVARGEIHLFIVSTGGGGAGGTGGAPGSTGAGSSTAAGHGPGSTGSHGSITAAGHGPSAAGGSSDGNTTQAITRWVESHYAKHTIGDTTVYVLHGTA